jgi:predicted transcriptional regulator of viral defense system
MDFPEAIRDTALWQKGIVSRGQLLEAGFARKLIERRLLRGHWRQLYRGVYALFTGPPTRDAWLWAAVLRAGPGAVLSHQTAAELHGLASHPVEAIHVTVPASRRVIRPVRRRGDVPAIVVHISGRIEEATQPNREPPRTSVEETVLDMTQSVRTFDDVCGWITRACGKRTTEEKIHAAMALRKKMRWRQELDEVLTAADNGIRSPLEFRYLRDVEKAHGLPAAEHQVHVVIDGRSAYRDAYYKQYKVAVELDGRLSHGDEQRSRDRHRDLVSSAEGIETCRLDVPAVYGRSCESALWVARVLRQHGWQEVPSPCCPTCPIDKAFPAWQARRAS